MTDKILHILAGFAIATVLQFSWIAIIVAALFFATAKELYDKAFDWKDFACTLAGGFIGYIFTLIY